jgi:hypothetical protein
MKAHVLDMLHEYDPRFNVHDFRMVDGENRINLIFDLEVPQDTEESEKEICAHVSEIIKRSDPRLNAVINVDYTF